MTERMREDKSLLKEPLPQAEEKILSFWKEIDLLKQVENKKPKSSGLFGGKKEFIFYEGPPTANGRPGIHHLLSRAFKDVVLRYKTMQGFHVQRRGGWDTHGLPVELQVEKEIGTKSKKDIESYGVAKFNEKCRESVWTYMEEWERFTDRIGYMIDQKNAYVTYKPEYIESVWNVVSKIADQDLLYKDYKVLPWCPRCGTALSSHELAQGYQDDKDLSVTAEFRLKDSPKTSILAWTTTPWTLAGHVALAVGKNIQYLEIEKKDMGDGELVRFIFAKDLAKKLFGDDEYKIVREMKGSELVGLKYLPPYEFLEKNIPASEKSKLSKAFQVYEAGFVNTEDGTGIVHTAVMYGQDDFVLGTKIGLPKYHLVDETGHFIKGTGFLEGKFVKEEATDVEIIKDLAHRGLLFKKEKYEHSYPHCWRCKTPLIYYARDSWYIAMSKLRDKLISENKKINWEPEYIKNGRFGEWLSDVKDWAISRERYWGTPLPVWESSDGERIFVDSVETLKKYTKKSGNKYFLMRHGWSDSNEAGKINGDKNREIHLLPQGINVAKNEAKKLKGVNVTKIFCSEFIRTQETAKIAKDANNIEAEIVLDKRLNEVNFGELEWSDRVEYKKRTAKRDAFTSAPAHGETLNDVKKRVGEFLYEIESKYQNENILIVSHGDPLWMMDSVAHGFDEHKSLTIAGPRYLETGLLRELDFTSIPHDKNFDLDLHKPFIDEVVLVKNGKEFRRVKEVMDVWFDSGAMPFAQEHYPFEKKKLPYPADYICEGLDQTRGWFYTLHAIGALLGKGRAYKNVICLGLLLDKDGKKMSKSVGNIVDPWKAMEEFGADPLRFWMFAVKEPGEPKSFDPESVKDLSRKVFALLSNVYTFFETYGGEIVPSDTSKNILDKWILARLSETEEIVSKGMDAYKIVEPARAIRDFIADFSQWYIRRSRERFKDNDWGAPATTRFVLHNLARIMAPFTPFYAEMIWKSVRTDKDEISVHLAEWPKTGSVDKQLLRDMELARKIVSEVLMQRNVKNIKVRQPLASLKIQDERLKNKKDLVEIIKDEVNVKEIFFDVQMTNGFELDIKITHELKTEGDMRDLIRAIQEKRKEMNLTPKDLVKVVVKNTHDKNRDIGHFAALIKKQANVSDLVFEEGDEGVEVFSL